MPRNAVLLFIDATTLRWFPPLRFAWGFEGEQVVVKITGRNAKRVLFGAINPRTGHRLVLRRFRQRQEDFQAFLRYPIFLNPPREMPSFRGLHFGKAHKHSGSSFKLAVV
jgi:hypothetical protein